MSKHVGLALVAALGMGACSGSTLPAVSTDLGATTTSPATTAAVADSNDTVGSISVPTPAVDEPRPRATSYRLELVEVLPHDRDAFTQGLLIRDGLLYESTGQYGRSAVRVVDPETGEVLRSRPLPDGFFGEGLELVDGRLVQLTWQEETAFVWDAVTLQPLGTLSYEGEGWGLCARDGEFVMSDGSALLTIRHLETFAVLDTLEVTFEGQPVDRLNELECTEASIMANVWKTDTIVVIDPESGVVDARIDAGELRERLSSTDGIDVLNGIAHDPEADRFYLTGKYWPDLFVVRLVPDG